MHTAYIALLSLTVGALAQAPIIFPWICLERCNDTNIPFELNQLDVNRSVFAAGGAMFELFNLGPNSTLIVNNLTNVAPSIVSYGLPATAMISSYPYPPEFLHYMRQVFATPQPFLDAVIAAAKTYKLSGINFDWEPSTGSGDPVPTPQDTAAYAAFLGVASDALHAAGLKVSVDVATWSKIWDLAAIGKTSIDMVISMGTYTDNWTSWQAQLNDLLNAVPLGKAVVGFESTRPSDGLPYNETQLKERFDALKVRGVRSVGIWKSPIPDNFWPYLRAL